MPENRKEFVIKIELTDALSRLCIWRMGLRAAMIGMWTLFIVGSAMATFLYLAVDDHFASGCVCGLTGCALLAAYGMANSSFQFNTKTLQKMWDREIVYRFRESGYSLTSCLGHSELVWDTATHLRCDTDYWLFRSAYTRVILIPTEQLTDGLKELIKAKVKGLHMRR